MACAAAIVGLTVSALVAAGASAGQSPPTLRLREEWSNYFGGQAVPLHFVVETSEAFSGHLGLGLVAEGGRRLWRQEVAVRTWAGRSETVEVRVPLPPVHPGNVLPLVIEGSLYAPHGNTLARMHTSIWLFPANPFAGQNARFRAWNIGVYDPQGGTWEALKSLGVPCQRIYDAAVISRRTEGVLVIGEGVSWRQYPALPELMMNAAARGLPVLALAPSSGDLLLPGRGDGQVPAAAALILHRQDVIAKLDKRLDWRAWPTEGRVVARGLALRARNGTVRAEVSQPPDWPWLEIHYPHEQRGHTRLVICGFALLEKWEASPTPRFLLARLLEYVAACGQPGTGTSESPDERTACHERPFDCTD